MKTVNVENIEKRIANINSALKNSALTKYMLPIELKQLRFEEDCLCKLLELMENKNELSNLVELPHPFAWSPGGEKYYSEDQLKKVILKLGYEVKS